MRQMLIGTVFYSMSDPFVGGQIEIQKQTDIGFCWLLAPFGALSNNKQPIFPSFTFYLFNLAFILLA
jgi:hypothetical protein